MLEVLTNPNNFFKNKLNEDISFKTPIAIVFVIGIIGAINAIFVIQKIMAELLGDAATFASIGTILGAVGAIISVFVMWVIYAAIFYAISLFFKGKGEFKRVLEFVGYGLIPSIAGSTIGLIAMIIALPTIEFSTESPELVQQLMLSNPIIQASVIIGVIFTLWSTNIWIFGLMYSRNLPIKNAVITVGAPVGLYIIYNLYSIFG
ncbi:MAG: YIP1 family protein [Methanosarcinaceae archaeon]